MGYGSGEKKGPAELFDFQGLYHSSSRTVRNDVQEIKQR